MPNTNQLPPEIQEIREVVARTLWAWQQGLDPERDSHYIDIYWRTGFKVVDSSGFYDKADQLFSVLSKHGVMKMRDDQTLPLCPTAIMDNAGDKYWYFKAQEDYQKAGGRLVVNLDGTPVKEG